MVLGGDESIEALMEGRFSLEQIFNPDSTVYPSYRNSALNISSRWLIKERLNAEAWIGDFIFNSLIWRISNLEQKERQNITSYASGHPDNSLIRLILKYYRTKDIALLKNMEIDTVERCLKNATTSNGKNQKKKLSTNRLNATATAAQLVFDNNLNQINDIVEKVKKAVDDRPDTDKGDNIDISINGSKLKIKVEPTTEILCQTISTDEYWGGVIHADVDNPKDAVDDLGKYELEAFDSSYINIRIREYLTRAQKYLTDSDAAVEISTSFEAFVNMRKNIIPYRKRLQDIPMLQIVSCYCISFNKQYF